MIRPRPLLRRVSAGLLICWSVGLIAAAPAHAENKVAFTLSDPAITESSGLARDVPGQRYWTVNDSGNSARAYAVNGSGAVRGWAGIRAQPTDVEAIAYYGGRLYLADIGDNEAKRNHVTIYVLYNPQPNNKNVEYHSYDLRYPDGPRDAETLLISPAGRIYLVSKEARGGIYAAPVHPSRTQTSTLQRIADAPAWVTDGQFLPDGSRIALRTYVSAQLLDATSHRVVARAATPPQPQGESLSVDLAGTSLLVGSEGRSSAVYRMPIPQRGGSAPTAGPTPQQATTTKATGAATAAPTSAETPAAETPAAEDGGGGSGGGMGVGAPLLIAAVVAAAAGLVVYFTRRTS